jgi:hypothetical protein
MLIDNSAAMAIGLGAQAMSAEEAYCWQSRRSAAAGISQAPKALRALLSGK